MVAIAADSVEDMAALQTKLPRLTLLTDLELRGAAAWGSHFPGSESPTPSTFIVGGDGVVRYRRFYAKGGDWPTYRELAAALE